MKPEIKKDWLKRAKEHAAADRFIKGKWLNGMVGDYKSGCFFGCMTQSNNNTIELAANQMTSPLWLVHLAECIFEGLPDEESVNFPVDYMNAIPDSLNDKEYEEIRHKISIKRMKRMYAIVETIEAIETEENYKQEYLDAICLISNYHENPTELAANSARAVAKSARAAAESVARAAVESVAKSARAAVESAESNEYINERDDLYSVFAEYK